MTFIDYRNFLNNNSDFYLYKAVVASEVDYFSDVTGLDLSDDDYTTICNFVYDWIMNSETTADEVARLVCRGLAKNEISLADFDNYQENDYRSKAEIWLSKQF